MNRAVRTTVVIGTIVLAAYLAYWYYRRRNEKRRVKSRLISRKKELAQNGTESQSVIDSSTQGTKFAKKSGTTKTSAPELSPHEVNQQENESPSKSGPQGSDQHKVVLTKSESSQQEWCLYEIDLQDFESLKSSEKPCQHYMEPIKKSKVAQQERNFDEINLQEFESPESPEEPYQQQMEPIKKSSSSESSEHGPSPACIDLDRVPRSYSEEEIISYVTSLPCAPGTEKQGTGYMDGSSYEKYKSCPDLIHDIESSSFEDAKQSELTIRSSAENLLHSLVDVESLLDSMTDVVATMVHIVENAEARVEEDLATALSQMSIGEPTASVIISEDPDGTCRIRKLTTIDEDKELKVRVEKKQISSKQEIVEQTSEEMHGAAQAESSVVSKEKDSEEESFVGRKILELASRIVQSEEQKVSPNASIHGITSESFASVTFANEPSYAELYKDAKNLEKEYALSTYAEGKISAGCLHASACYYLARQHKNDSPQRQQFIIEGFAVADNIFRKYNDFRALRWLALLSIEKIRYLDNDAKFDLFVDINVMMQTMRDFYQEDHILVYFSGRVYYEYVCYALEEMREEISSGSKLLDAAIILFENACCMTYPVVSMECLYYLARCFIMKEEKEKAKKLLPLTERISLFDLAEVEYLYEMKKMLM